MNTQDKQEWARREGFPNAIGVKLPASLFDFFSDRSRYIGDEFEIIGYGFSDYNRRLLRFLRFKNFECTFFPGGKFLDQLDAKSRQTKARELGILRKIGRKVKSTSINAYRTGDTAEIVGWGFLPEDGRPLYYIRFDDGECDYIPGGKLFKASGYVFV